MTRTTKKLAVLLNGRSGTALDEAGRSKLEKAFAEAGCDARIQVMGPGDDLARAIERAAAEKPDAVVVGGGDGTLSTAAGVLARGPVPLGVLPLGTLNHFARDLGIPMDLEEAVRAIAAGERIEVDLAEVNGRVFINNSSLGLYPSIVRRREILRQELPFARKKGPALLWATVLALRLTPLLEVEVTIDGRTRRLRTPFVFIGNNQYTLEGLSAGTREGLQDGLLGVHTTTRQDRFGVVALALRALFGRLSGTRDFQSSTAAAFEVRSRRTRLLVATDGEVQVMETPLRYRIRPRALGVLVPPAEAHREAA